MASSIETSLKRLEHIIRARHGCKHPNGLMEPSDEEAACPSCKGKRNVKVFTREQMAEFRTLFAEQQWERELIESI